MVIKWGGGAYFLKIDFFLPSVPKFLMPLFCGQCFYASHFRHLRRNFFLMTSEFFCWTPPLWPFPQGPIILSTNTQPQVHWSIPVEMRANLAHATGQTSPPPKWTQKKWLFFVVVEETFCAVFRPNINPESSVKLLPPGKAVFLQQNYFS